MAKTNRTACRSDGFATIRYDLLGRGRLIMTTAAEALKTQLAKLPSAERAELARYLVDTLDEVTDADAETAWDEELARREQEIGSGIAAGEPAASVFARRGDRLS